LEVYSAVAITIPGGGSIYWEDFMRYGLNKLETWLSVDEDCIMIGLVVLTQYRFVTDRQNMITRTACGRHQVYIMLLTVKIAPNTFVIILAKYLENSSVSISVVVITLNDISEIKSIPRLSLLH